MLKFSKNVAHQKFKFLLEYKHSCINILTFHLIGNSYEGHSYIHIISLNVPSNKFKEIHTLMHMIRRKFHKKNTIQKLKQFLSCTQYRMASFLYQFDIIVII